MNSPNLSTESWPLGPQDHSNADPPVIRIHAEASAEPADSRGARRNETLRGFANLNRAFELATGWSLKLNRSVGSSESHVQRLEIVDLASCNFGNAPVGRRYAENLIEAVNTWLAQQGLDRKTRDD